MLELTVARKWQAATDVVALALRDAADAELPPVTPGAHVDVHLPGGLVRPYSLCNGRGAAREYLIAVKREPQSRGGSLAVHERVAVGDRLAVGAPRNNFPLAADARRHLLIAGGIGVTPLLSMARHLGADGVPHALHYFCRSRAHAAFADVLEQELGASLQLHVGLDASETRATVDALLIAPGDGAHVYSCGPQPLMGLVEELAVQRAWPREAVHFEYFHAPPTPTPVATGADSAFDVTLARSARTIRIAAGETVVQALRDAGVAIETSCEQGVCGTCLTGVLSGCPDHRDLYLTDAEKAAGTQMLPCVSRASTPSLTLDL